MIECMIDRIIFYYW